MTEAELLQAQKDEKKRHINEFRYTWMYSHFLYDNIQWDCDPSARGNISDLFDAVQLNGGAVPPEVPSWRDYNNIDRVFPNGDYAIQLKVQMIRHFSMCHLVCRYHKAAIDELLTIAEVNSYDYSTAWPNRDPV